MPLPALALALGAALLHAVWNLLLARRPDPEAATAVAILAGVVATTPAALLLWEVRPEVLPYVVASSGAELVYFALLGAAYARAELSVVYPLARGGAPVLVLIAGVLLLGLPTGAAQVAGVLLVAAGVALVRGMRREVPVGHVSLALAVAACIATYTLIDRTGIRLAGPVTYLWLVLLLPAIVYPLWLALRGGVQRLRREMLPSTMLAGLAMVSAYGLLLGALTLGHPASVVAVRESSVVIATLLGARLLRERVGRLRLAGSVLVTAGVALIALAS